MSFKFWEQYKRVCARGYTVLDQEKPGISELQSNPWMNGTAYPPSLGANGRYRFLRSLEEASSLDPSSVLEIAGGGGFFLACLAGRCGEASFVLNDIRTTDELSYWKHGNKIKFLGGDCFKLKIRREFELVCAFEVIEHVAHGDQFIQMLADCLKPGGTVLLSTPNGRFFRSKLPTYSQLNEEDRVKLEENQFKPDADGHLYLYTREELTNLLKKAGFENIEIFSEISPWLSGGCGFRFLPKSKYLLPIYYFLEKLVQFCPFFLRDRLTTNLLVKAKRTVSEVKAVA